MFFCFKVLLRTIGAAKSEIAAPYAAQQFCVMRGFKTAV
jgi:hypothetical protein